jgi:hypothetical protein
LRCAPQPSAVGDFEFVAAIIAFDGEEGIETLAVSFRVSGTNDHGKPFRDRFECGYAGIRAVCVRLCGAASLRHGITPIAPFAASWAI